MFRRYRIIRMVGLKLSAELLDVCRYLAEAILEFPGGWGQLTNGSHILRWGTGLYTHFVGVSDYVLTFKVFSLVSFYQ